MQDRKNSYEALKKLDVQVDSYSEKAMKIRDRQIKTALMDQIIEFKQKIAKVMEVMRADTNTEINNSLIAQLNDVAYKAIRKTGT